MKNEFVNYVLDLLSPHGNIRARAMFGGYGIYKDGIIAGIIIQDELYFKADKESATDYEAAGSRPFSYLSNGKMVKMSYWLVPLDIMEDEKLIGEWLERSWRISFEAKRKKEP